MIFNVKFVNKSDVCCIRQGTYSGYPMVFLNFPAKFWRPAVGSAGAEGQQLAGIQNWVPFLSKIIISAFSY